MTVIKQVFWKIPLVSSAIGWGNRKPCSKLFSVRFYSLKQAARQNNRLIDQLVNWLMKWI